MNIELNYTNIMDEIIYEEGISLLDFVNIKEKINTAYDKVMQKCKNDELGFMKIIYDDILIYYELKEYSKDFDNIVVIGMGGSILGTQAIYEGVKGIHYNDLNDKKVYFLDNSDPEKTFEILNIINLKKTLVFAISKSGNTAETLANFLIIEEKLKGITKDYKKNIVVVANTGELKNIADREGYKFYRMPENVGGRFSVFSAVGLAPLCCMDIDIEALIEGAKEMDKLCRNKDIFKNPALMNATIHYIAYNKGKTISVLMPYIERLHKFGLWYRQLWAESIGKNGIGQTPVISLGAKDQHSQLQLYMDGLKNIIITFITVHKFKYDLKIRSSNYLNNRTLSTLIHSEQKGTEISLTNNKIPNISINIDELNEYTIGKLIYLYEMQTAFMGELLEINAFNQPAVEGGKIITRKLLEECPVDEIKESKPTKKYCIEI
ncbi:glucose-6-phosphate isomerase [Methanococcus aeolicus]|uniref:Probable glucose-6-phosphate isomerase n=1 Tax=Methanococcus aeolicus (strain ATCC BAA-1280 / DSM 17508 / OCM 812 / Nankai-3) TaxID=419665 RepID=A6USX7_META3|nr:glucose-6-phosphate isomerase [Methanococcus aeolicus]ABR55599.1 Glucose-6-phosphate isomerase [Methanococcus aeolicus Nankai-3]UXM85098.1 glucose-6-phosphate isomerase [Methanococcus aeolicus]